MTSKVRKPTDHELLVIAWSVRHGAPTSSSQGSPSPPPGGGLSFARHPGRDLHVPPMKDATRGHSPIPRCLSRVLIPCRPALRAAVRRASRPSTTGTSRTSGRPATTSLTSTAGPARRRRSGAASATRPTERRSARTPTGGRLATRPTGRRSVLGHPYLSRRPRQPRSRLKRRESGAVGRVADSPGLPLSGHEQANDPALPLAQKRRVEGTEGSGAGQPLGRPVAWLVRSRGRRCRERHGAPGSLGTRTGRRGRRCPARVPG